jgi:hypothetical protein
MKPRIKATMDTFDRINWMNQINNGLCFIEEAKNNHLIPLPSYFKWKLTRQCELYWNEFYLNRSL